MKLEKTQPMRVLVPIATYLVNGDDSGITEEEKKKADELAEIFSKALVEGKAAAAGTDDRSEGSVSFSPVNIEDLEEDEDEIEFCECDVTSQHGDCVRLDALLFSEEE